VNTLSKLVHRFQQFAQPLADVRLRIAARIKDDVQFVGQESNPPNQIIVEFTSEAVSWGSLCSNV
jgi:hypothetical protein